MGIDHMNVLFLLLGFYNLDFAVYFVFIWIFWSLNGD